MKITLEDKLKRIKKVFGKEVLHTLVNPQVSSQDVCKYYKTNRLAYSLLHSRTNCVHMAISRDLKYKEEDLFEGAKFVKKYIKQTNAKEVLEIACGRGANTLYLARNCPDVNFEGLDISPAQLSYAQKNSKRINNAKFSIGNYHDLNSIKNDSKDIIFVIEALCHSNDKKKVLKEVKKKLTKEGILIILDGYLNKSLAELSNNEILAKRYVERGMAVNSFAYYPALVESANNLGFKVIHEEDATEFIIPNLRKLERLSKVLFNFTPTAKLLVKVLPFEFTKNAIAAYLFPEIMQKKVANYMITVLQTSTT